MELRKFVLLSVFAVLVFSGLGSAQSSDLLDEAAWSERPDYVQNMDISVSYEPVVEFRETREVCTSYSNTTLQNGSTVSQCDSYGTEVYGGSNTYIFDVTDLSKEYLGNGDVRLSFTVERNELTKELFKSQKNPRQEEKFIDFFNSNYLFRDSGIDSTSYDSFLGFTKDVSVSSLGDSLRDKRLESKNLMAVSNSRITTVVSLSDFRSGGVVLNDAVTVEVESSIA